MVKIKKQMDFLDFMVKMVFFATFAFTGVMVFISWNLNWESMASLLVDKWFTIMVGELIIMGSIQIAKEITQSRLRINEFKIRQKLDKKEEVDYDQQ